VFQVVVCVLSARQRATHTLPGTQYTHHSLKHMLPQYCTTYNNVFYRLLLQKCDFSQAQYRLPEDGPGGPKHVRANVGYFNVNFNILYV